MVLKLFQKTEIEKTLPNLFCEVTVTLTHKPHSPERERERMRIYYSLISLLNIDVKIFNKYLQTESKNTSSIMIKQPSFYRCRDNSVYKNQ